MELEHRVPTPSQARLGRLAQILRVRRRGRGPHPRPHSEGHRTGCAPARFLPHTLRPETLAGRHGKALEHHQRYTLAVSGPQTGQRPFNPLWNSPLAGMRAHRPDLLKTSSSLCPCFISPYIGGQNLSLEPVPPYLQWVTAI